MQTLNNTSIDSLATSEGLSFWRKMPFTPIGDERGQLLAFEKSTHVPFEIQRVYYIYDTQAGVVRGKHAHQELSQVLIAVSGSCKVMLDNGTERETVTLDNCEEGLYVKGLIWREMFDFSPGCVLLVLASAPYDESDYIRDYGDFKARLPR